MTTIVRGKSLQSDHRGQTTDPPGIALNQRRTDFRSDIEGLRAVAIFLIVGYHAGIPGFAGGLVGPEVFFVISGFLITRRLLEDSASSGSVPFAEFWARRIRRLVPGLGLMVAVTLLASLVIINPFDMLETAKEGAASALYVSNYLFAQNSQNYFASNPDKSPFLNTWTLGVEEQFYLLWPFLVWGLLMVCRRRLHILRRASLVLFAALFTASFALNVVWTNAGSVWSFFSLPTRAWEFAVGGFLGSLTFLRAVNRVVLAALGFVGLALLIAVTEIFTASTPYPGWSALFPVLATALLIAAGSRGLETSPISRLLSVRPMQWTGRISYSWYLWYWPFIVLTVTATKSSSTLVMSAAALASLGGAVVAFRFVENPIRFARRLRRPPYKTYLLALAITVGVLGIAGASWLYSSQRTPASLNQLEFVAAKGFLPACHVSTAPGGAQYCYGGDLSSTRTVAIVGDSHASVWFNEVADVAARDKTRALLVSNPGCPFIDVNVEPSDINGGPKNTALCSTERASAMSFLAKARPSSIVLTEHTGLYLPYILDRSGGVPSQSDQIALWKDAFAAFIHNEQASGASVGVILDNPVLPQTPAECVAQSGSISECEPSRAEALGPDRTLVGVEQKVLDQFHDVPYFSPNGVLCNGSGCPLEIQGKLMYVDDNHLSNAATQLLAPQVSALVSSLLSAQN